MNIGLYFGSFNPIHVGHLIIANHMVEYGEVDQVWMVVSPHNPHKQKNTLLADHHRLALVKEAIDSNPRLRVSDIEFGLAQPNYTVKTLAYLKEHHPDHQFTLIMGEDNLRSLHKWYNYEQVLQHDILVYPRVYTPRELEETLPEKSSELLNHPNVTFLKDLPLMAVSSSYIRKAISEGKDVRYLLTDPVHKYIEEMHFYR